MTMLANAIVGLMITTLIAFILAWVSILPTLGLLWLAGGLS